MSLKSIRESYSKLLTTFNDAGIKLNESQKSDIDTFILALESTMSKQRELAIRKTKKAVTEKLESEFKTIFESVMESMQENNALASKIQNLSTKLVESKKIAKQVDDYLNLYVESVLPKKTIVDYDRMQKLEKVHESLKDMLAVSEDVIVEKQKSLDESFKSAKSKCETEVAKMQVKLNESAKREKTLQKKLDSLKAVELLESKTRDLPTFEARAVKKEFAESTEKEIKENFSKVLESIRAKAKKITEAEQKKTETTLESEIEKIVNDDELSEDDMLKTSPHNGAAQHNGHIAEDDLEEDDLLMNRNHNNHISEEEEVDEDDMLKTSPHNGDAQHNGHLREEEDLEEFETMEEVKEDSDGNIELEESEIIDPDLMKFWTTRAQEII